MRFAIRLESDYLIGLGWAARHFHTGRAHGHAWDGEASNLRPLVQQTLDHVGRDVSFNHITLDYGCVASCQDRRHTMALLDGSEVRGMVNLYWETMTRQVRDPRTATASRRRLVDSDGRFLPLSPG